MVSVEMTYLGTEDTGEVDGGILTLAGPCALAKIDIERSYDYDENMKVARSIQSDEGRNLHEKDKTKVIVVFDTLDDVTEEVLLIWVCVQNVHDVTWFGRGLVLVREEEDKYRRLGMASCYFDNKDPARLFSAGVSQKQIRII